MMHGGPTASETPGLPMWSWDDLEIGDELGRGAVGAVHAAHHRPSKRTVAVKVLAADEAVRSIAADYLARELAIAARLDHPNIVSFLGAGQGPSGAFLVMELVPGANLFEHLALGRALEPADAVRMGLDMLAALQHAHDRGVVHRDVKPENVMVQTTDVDRPMARLLDFGLARVYEGAKLRTLTHTGEARGTLLYAAPECIDNARDAKPAADIFSTGATLYTALTGTTPYEEGLTYGDLISSIRRGAVVPLRTRRPDTSPLLAHVIHKALALAPASRWTSAAAMSQALGSV